MSPLSNRNYRQINDNQIDLINYFFFETLNRLKTHKSEARRLAAIRRIWTAVLASPSVYNFFEEILQTCESSTNAFPFNESSTNLIKLSISDMQGDM